MPARPRFGSSGGAWSVSAPRVSDTPIDLPKLRKRISGQIHPLTQEAFAKRFGFSAAAVRDWEQGRRRPSRSARLLLAMIEREPKAVQRVLDAL